MSEQDEQVVTYGEPPDVMAVNCDRCERVVMATTHGYTIFQEGGGGLFERYTLMSCKPKNHPLLVMQEDFMSPNNFDDDEPYRMYPPQDRHLSTQIPRSLRSTHGEARKCLGAKAYQAAFMMAGSTLEQVCKLHGFKTGSLQKKLEQMRDKQIIDGRLFDWANTLRHVRNEATHDVDANISRLDAEDAVALSEALLDYLYVFTARFEAMKKRRSVPILNLDLQPGSPAALLATAAALWMQRKATVESGPGPEQNSDRPDALSTHPAEAD